jgi:hypothetical protein
MFGYSATWIQVVPIENREGKKLIEREGDFCERKNGRGVDPNRNWEVDWGKREKDYSAYEENAGSHAFSEPEVYILRNLVHEFKPHVWVNVHSGALLQLTVSNIAFCNALKAKHEK